MIQWFHILGTSVFHRTGRWKTFKRAYENISEISAAHRMVMSVILLPQSLNNCSHFSFFYVILIIVHRFLDKREWHDGSIHNRRHSFLRLRYRQQLTQEPWCRVQALPARSVPNEGTKNYWRHFRLLCTRPNEDFPNTNCGQQGRKLCQESCVEYSGIQVSTSQLVCARNADDTDKKSTLINADIR